MQYRECYELGKKALAGADIPEADLDARLLLEFVCGTDRNTLLVHGDREVGEMEAKRYFDRISERSAHIPLQQITGVQDFMGLEFFVNEHVLIPRQDTEVLVEEVLQNLHDGMDILDVCTGSGCILISLLHYSNNCCGVGTDISSEAIAVAEKNASKLIDDEHISFVQGDLFEKVEGSFDIVVSNPPYIPCDIVETLMPEVRDHEPRLALDGSEDGLLFYRRIVEECKKNLKMGGMLFFEIGYDQGEAVSKLMEDAGFLEVQVKKDYAGQDRVVFGTRRFEL